MHPFIINYGGIVLYTNDLISMFHQIIQRTNIFVKNLGIQFMNTIFTRPFFNLNFIARFISVSLSFFNLLIAAKFTNIPALCQHLNSIIKQRLLQIKHKKHVPRGTCFFSPLYKDRISRFLCFQYRNVCPLNIVCTILSFALDFLYFINITGQPQPFTCRFNTTLCTN